MRTQSKNSAPQSKAVWKGLARGFMQNSQQRGYGDLQGTRHVIVTGFSVKMDKVLRCSFKFL